MISINNFTNQRLGNQLFMIAAAYSLSIDYNDTIVLPEWKYSPIFKNFNIKTLNKKMNFHNFYNEENYGFHYNKILYKNDLLLNGYFQSEKYFVENKIKIHELFLPNDNLIKDLTNKFPELINKEKTCAIHIRRTDYLTKQEYHPVLPISYYTKAINMIGDNKFVFFSDDIEWCKSMFTNEDFIFIESQTDIEDLIMMSLMENNIIANSSFSWWGAWLNKNKNKTVIAPKIWFGPAYLHYNTSDIVPETWIKI